MEINWLRESVHAIASMCILTGIVECLTPDERSGSSLRLICGAAAASFICQSAASGIKQLL